MKNYTTPKLALAIFTLGLLAGCTSRSGPPASVHYDKAVSPYYVVKKGDSIASIARKYGMDKRELIRINGLESPYRIVKGKRLLVRPHETSSAQDESEMPATEEVGPVPEDGDVEVKPLKAVSKEVEGRLNPESDDEADSGVDGEGEYDEEKVDRAEEKTKHQDRDRDRDRDRDNHQPSSLPATPPSTGKYQWPTQGTLKRNFNPSGKGKTQNDGINISAPKGTAVVAANNGVVAHTGNQLRGFGNVVLVKHDNDTMTVYAHLDKVSVKKGDVVDTGQKLGTVGQTGTVKEPQLHFEIRKGRKPIDPSRYLQG